MTRPRVLYTTIRPPRHPSTECAYRVVRPPCVALSCKSRQIDILCYRIAWVTAGNTQVYFFVKETDYNHGITHFLITEHL